MSFYATIQGKIKYNTVEAFQNALNLLKKGFWVNENNFWIDEANETFGEDNNIDIENLTITIPYNLYRNMSRIIGKTCFDGSPGLFTEGTGLIVWASIDGCYSGGVIKDGIETEYDLKDWGIRNSNGDEVPDENSDDFVDWIIQVEGDFINTFYTLD